MTVVYSVKLAETSEEFAKKYKKYAEHLIQNRENPEFGEIIFLEKNKKEIKKFFSQNAGKCDEYMKPVFNFYLCCKKEKY